jgi:mRNA interferase HigB
MHVLSRKTFNDAKRKFIDDANALGDLYKVLKAGDFHSPEELKKVMATLDNFKYKDKWWIINTR